MGYCTGANTAPANVGEAPLAEADNLFVSNGCRSWMDGLYDTCTTFQTGEHGGTDTAGLNHYLYKYVNSVSGKFT